MINEWINDAVHPITGIKEHYRVELSKSTSRKHKYDYEFDIKLPDHA